jgi:hypothetical protein
METVANRLPARRRVLLALVALLGLTIVAGTASVDASASTRATVAKKKCKKHQHSARAAKKKCKKVQVHHFVLPAPLVRATLSWSVNDEVDLHAFDAGGHHAGWVQPPDPGSLVQGIPNAHHSGDVGPGGPFESFTDDIFVFGGASNREFSYVACLYGEPDPDPYGATFTGVTASGQSSSLPLTGPGEFTLTVPGGPTIPAFFTCP